jgi:hypothetical protein
MIPSGVALGVNRILTTFGDVAVHDITISGSGFWLESEEKKWLFVTNRHNVDPNLRSDTKGYRTTRVELELRTDPDGADPRVQSFEVADLDRCLFVSDSADCAVFADPHLKGLAAPFEIWKMATEWYLAGDKDDVWRWLGMGDLATFIGFAGSGGDANSRWWDQKHGIPIGRLVSLSSHPGVAFEHPSICTGDAGLVSGLSFSGASGSPLLSHEKRGGSNGFGEVSFDDHVAESKIIGIMSGHLLAEQGGLFDHSGLSYYTRAPSIAGLIKAARACAFVNEKPYDFVFRKDEETKD